MFKYQPKDLYNIYSYSQLNVDFASAFFFLLKIGENPTSYSRKTTDVYCSNKYSAIEKHDRSNLVLPSVLAIIHPSAKLRVPRARHNTNRPYASKWLDKFKGNDLLSPWHPTLPMLANNRTFLLQGLALFPHHLVCVRLHKSPSCRR